MSKCRGCPAEIEWFQNPKTDKRVPLDVGTQRCIVDPTSKEWYYDASLNGDTIKGRLLAPDAVAKGDNIVPVRVSHYRTCPDANRFSKGSKKP